MYLTPLKTIANLLIVLTISGCSSLSFFDTEPPPPPIVEVRTIEVKIPITHPILPRGIDLKEPQFYVVSEKNLDGFLSDMDKQNGTIVFIALTLDDYELMSYNIQEIKRYISQLKEVVIYYRELDNDEEIDNAETKPTKGDIK